MSVRQIFYRTLSSFVIPKNDSFKKIIDAKSSWKLCQTISLQPKTIVPACLRLRQVLSTFPLLLNNKTIKVSKERAQKYRIHEISSPSSVPPDPTWDNSSTKKTETLNDFLEISDIFRLHKLSWSPESVMEEFYDLRYHKKSDRQKCSTS